MKSRFKIGILFTVGFTLLLGLLWTSLVAADRVATEPSTSQSIKNNAPADDSSAARSQDSNTSKAVTSGTDTKPGKATKNGQSTVDRSENNPNATSTSTKADSHSSSSSAVSANSNSQTTATITVPVVSSSDQQTADQVVTSESDNNIDTKHVKKVTLTTPSDCRLSKHQDLDRLASLPQTGKETLLLTGGVVSLVLMPAVIIIFNTLV